MQKVYKALYKVGRHVNEMLNYNTFNTQGAAVHANPHPSSTTTLKPEHHVGKILS